VNLEHGGLLGYLDRKTCVERPECYDWSGATLQLHKSGGGDVTTMGWQLEQAQATLPAFPGGKPSEPAAVRSDAGADRRPLPALQMKNCFSKLRTDEMGIQSLSFFEANNGIPVTFSPIGTSSLPTSSSWVADSGIGGSSEGWWQPDGPNFSGWRLEVRMRRQPLGSDAVWNICVAA